MGATLGTTITADGGTVSYEAEFSGGGIQGPMGDMVTKKAGEEIEASLEKLKGLRVSVAASDWKLDKLGEWTEPVAFEVSARADRRLRGGDQRRASGAPRR